jgi:hypothetical protein
VFYRQRLGDVLLTYENEVVLTNQVGYSSGLGKGEGGTQTSGWGTGEGQTQTSGLGKGEGGTQSGRRLEVRGLGCRGT